MKTPSKRALALIALVLLAATAATAATALAAPKKKILIQEQVAEPVQQASQAILRAKIKAVRPRYIQPATVRRAGK